MMNRRKIFIMAICLILAVCVIGAAACTAKQVQEKSVFEQITELAAKAVNVNLSVSSGGDVIYTYSSANSSINNPYELDIDPAALLGTATGGVLLTRDRIEEGYTLTYDSVTGEAKLTCKLKNTGEWLGVNADGATAVISANIKAGVLVSYSVTYSSGDYTVSISLS